MENNIKVKEIELFNRYKNGDLDAKKELIASLAPVINSQVSKFNNSGLPPFAIKLEGQKLTSLAIDNYDPSKSQLNTHVTNYLQKLNRFVSTYQNVGHIPEPRILLIGKYNTTFANLSSELNREPTVLELSEAMKISPIEIERLQTELRNDLSTTIIDDSDDGTGFYQYVRDQNTGTKEAIDFVYFEADPIDKKILEYTLGLGGVQKLGNKEIALKLSINELELKQRKLKLSQEIKQLI